MTTIEKLAQFNKKNFSEYLMYIGANALIANAEYVQILAVEEELKTD